MGHIGISKREMVEWAAETFGVRIESKEIDRLHTLRDLHDLVLMKLAGAMPAAEGTRAGRCLSSHAFYRVRRALMEVCGVERRQVRPDAELRDLLPRRNRHRVWRQLREHSGLPLPGLDPSVPLLVGMGFIGMPLAMVVGALAVNAGMAVVGFLAFLTALVVSPLIPTSWWLATRLSPQPRGETVRELVLLTFLRGYGRIARETGAWRVRECSDTLRAMAADASVLTIWNGQDVRLDDTFEYLGIR